MAEPLERSSPLGAVAPPRADLAGPVVLTVRHALTMIDVRCAPNDESRRALRTLLGRELPGANATAPIGEGVIFWMGPDQWLFVGGSNADMEPLSTAAGVTLTDVSHGRVAVGLSGPRARDVLSKGCMLDLHPAVFQPGACAQTAIAKIPVIVHRTGSGDYDLYAPRSYARSLWHWLAQSADEYGYHVARAP